MKEITINGAKVYELSDDWSVGDMIALALNSDAFTIEHEQDADYGQLKIFTHTDGLWSRVREISEHQIANEELGDRFGFAFIKTVDHSHAFDDEGRRTADHVRYWLAEAFEDEEETA